MDVTCGMCIDAVLCMHVWIDVCMQSVYQVTGRHGAAPGGSSIRARTLFVISITSLRNGDLISEIGWSDCDLVLLVWRACCVAWARWDSHCLGGLH